MAPVGGTALWWAPGWWAGAAAGPPLPVPAASKASRRARASRPIAQMPRFLRTRREVRSGRGPAADAPIRAGSRVRRQGPPGRGPARGGGARGAADVLSRGQEIEARRRASISPDGSLQRDEVLRPLKVMVPTARGRCPMARPTLRWRPPSSPTAASVGGGDPESPGLAIPIETDPPDLYRCRHLLNPGSHLGRWRSSNPWCTRSPTGEWAASSRQLAATSLSTTTSASPPPPGSVGGTGSPAVPGPTGHWHPPASQWPGRSGRRWWRTRTPRADRPSTARPVPTAATSAATGNGRSPRWRDRC